METSRLTRDGTAEPVLRNQILRRERGQGNIHFSCSTSRIDNLTRLIHALAVEYVVVVVLLLIRTFTLVGEILGHRVLSCMMCVVNFVFALSQLQGVEWGWPDRREPDDEHSPASYSYTEYFVCDSASEFGEMGSTSILGFSCPNLLVS